MRNDRLQERAAMHAALGDPVRLAIVDELVASDRSPGELCRSIGVGSNLLAHHLDVLEAAGLTERLRSSGDGRRRYVRLRRDAVGGLDAGRRVAAGPAMFVCSANSARSQLAAALWRRIADAPARSAGTHPAAAVHPGAVAAARRAGLDLGDGMPTRLATDAPLPAIVVTVCDRAHEELDPPPTWLHWSVPDPVEGGSAAAFDGAVVEIADRIDALVSAGRRTTHQDGSPT